MVRVGLVGCGTIGTQVALAIQRRYARQARVIALHDQTHANALRLQRRLRHPSRIVSLPQLILASDLVIEAASSRIAADVARRALRARRDVMIMSAGGLLGSRAWRRAAASGRGRLLVPSGALAGLDGVRALAVGSIRSLRLTTSKPPRALVGADYVRRRGIRLTGLKRPRVLFEGSPSAAVKAFPQNTNVAAAMALSSGAPERRMRVRVIADPRLRVNVHELTAEGDCGRVSCRIESRPSANPKTSELAVRSAIAALARLFDPVTVGT